LDQHRRRAPKVELTKEHPHEDGSLFGRLIICEFILSGQHLLLIIQRSARMPAFPVRDVALCGAFIDALLRMPLPPTEPSTAMPVLSFRLSEVLELLKTGMCEKEIAGWLKISIHTVHVHVKAIYRRFGVHSRSELLSLFLHVKPVIPKPTFFQENTHAGGSPKQPLRIPLFVQGRSTLSTVPANSLGRDTASRSAAARTEGARLPRTTHPERFY
jgi:DNA-binding CsgD family transcriptional regulator